MLPASICMLLGRKVPEVLQRSIFFWNPRKLTSHQPEMTGENTIIFEGQCLAFHSAEVCMHVIQCSIPSPWIVYLKASEVLSWNAAGNRGLREAKLALKCGCICGHIPWYAFRFYSSRNKAKSMGCAELVGKPSSLVNVTRRGALRLYDPPQGAWIFFSSNSKSDGADPTELLGGCSHGVIYYHLSMFVWFCGCTFFHIISERPPEIPMFSPCLVAPKAQVAYLVL